MKRWITSPAVKLDIHIQTDIVCDMAFYSSSGWVQDIDFEVAARAASVLPRSNSMCWGGTKVASYCCIDRYSNYSLRSSVPIFMQQRQAFSKSHYMLAERKAKYSMALALKDTLTPSGGKTSNCVMDCVMEIILWLLIYWFRVGCHINHWTALIVAQVHLKALNLSVTGLNRFKEHLTNGDVFSCCCIKYQSVLIKITTSLILPSTQHLFCA